MLLKDSMYSWWVHPLAVGDTVGGDPVTWVGSVDRRGGNTVHRVNAATGAVDSVALAGPATADEHNGVALAVDASQDDLIAFYSRHGNDQHVRYQTVNRSTLAAGVQQTLAFGGNVTYAQVLQRGSTIHLLCRVAATGGPYWRYRTSTDWGASWGTEKTIIDPNGIGQNYLQARPDWSSSDLVHLAHYGHPANSSYPDVGYARLDLTTGRITRLNGTLLGDLDDAGGPAITPQELDLAITPSSGYRVRVLDVGGPVQTQPAIAYAVWYTPNSSQPATYKVKRYTGSGWSSESWQLAAGDVFGFNLATHYHGGIGMGPSGRMWTSREAGGDWIIEEWDRSGSTYDLVGELARGKTRLLRPYPVRGAAGLPVIWQDCLWEHYYTRYYGDTVG